MQLIRRVKKMKTGASLVSPVDTVPFLSGRGLAVPDAGGQYHPSPCCCHGNDCFVLEISSYCG